MYHPLTFDIIKILYLAEERVWLESVELGT
jgi:hypothetical protein